MINALKIFRMLLLVTVKAKLFKSPIINVKDHRQIGKTSMLLKEASKTKGTVIEPDKNRMKYARYLASNLGLKGVNIIDAMTYTSRQYAHIWPAMKNFDTIYIDEQSTVEDLDYLTNRASIRGDLLKIVIVTNRTPVTKQLKVNILANKASLRR